MWLNFKVCKVKQGSPTYERFDSNQHLKRLNRLELIIVGEDQGAYLVQEVQKEGLKMVADFKINELAYTVPKEDIEFKTDDSGFGQYEYEFDIPKDRLTVEIIDDIQRINR